MNKNITVFKEGRNIGDVVKWEVFQDYSRDAGVLAAGAGDVEIGLVLGQKADGNFAPINPTATTGEQVATGVLLNNLTATDTATDVDVTILARAALVSQSQLIWPAGATDAQIATSLAELKAAGIVAREEV